MQKIQRMLDLFTVFYSFLPALDIIMQQPTE